MHLMMFQKKQSNVWNDIHWKEEKETCLKN